MSKQEREEFKRAVASLTKELASDKEASRRFLVKVGLFTEKGNLRKPFKDLCIPQGRD